MLLRQVAPCCLDLCVLLVVVCKHKRNFGRTSTSEGRIPSKKSSVRFRGPLPVFECSHDFCFSTSLRFHLRLIKGHHSLRIHVVAKDVEPLRRSVNRKGHIVDYPRRHYRYRLCQSGCFRHPSTLEGHLARFLKREDHMEQPVLHRDTMAHIQKMSYKKKLFEKPTGGQFPRIVVSLRKGVRERYTNVDDADI